MFDKLFDDPETAFLVCGNRHNDIDFTLEVVFKILCAFMEEYINIVYLICYIHLCGYIMGTFLYTLF